MKHIDFSLEDNLRSSKLPNAAKLLYALLPETNRDLCANNMLTQIIDNTENNPLGMNVSQSELQAKLLYDQEIVEHPCVRLGRRINAVLNRVRS